MWVSDFLRNSLHLLVFSTHLISVVSFSGANHQITFELPVDIKCALRHNPPVCPISLYKCGGYFGHQLQQFKVCQKFFASTPVNCHCTVTSQTLPYSVTTKIFHHFCQRLSVFDSDFHSCFVTCRIPV